jgi:hypothetical protein
MLGEWPRLHSVSIWRKVVLWIDLAGIIGMCELTCDAPGHIPMSRLIVDLAHGLRLRPKGPYLTHISNVRIFPGVIHRACRQTSSAGLNVSWPQSFRTLYEMEMPMTSEMTEKSYKAVRCSYCSEPIPLSARLSELFVAEYDNTTEAQCRSQVFILRCEACSKESRYLKAEIDILEGEPRQRGDVNRSGPRCYPKSLRKAVAKNLSG